VRFGRVETRHAVDDVVQIVVQAATWLAAR
jgi:hypothetical protein